MRNSVVSCKHNIGYKSDHSKVSLNIDLISLTRGPGYFKLNNSLLLDKDYQETVKKSIAEINKEANPNTKWELIKDTIRNETIKYATYKKNETNKQEKKLTNELWESFPIQKWSLFPNFMYFSIYCPNFNTLFSQM